MEAISEGMDEAVENSKGSKRHNKGKPQVSQLSPEFILDLANLMTKTAESGKYEEFNWTKGQNYRTAYDSLQRHMLAYYSGEDIDPDSGFPHLLCAGANLMIMYHSYKNHPDLDDRPKAFKK